MTFTRMEGKVEIPKGERPWAKRLMGNFEHLNPEIQGSIVSIITEIRKESPDKALEIAHKIGDFFSHTGDYAKDSNVSIQEFLEQLQVELQKERNKHIQ